MTKFQLNRPDAPWDYPTLGFTATTSTAILDGSLSDPALTIPPDAYWSVYVGGSAETGITRYQTPAIGPAPTPETSDGYVLVYRDEDNRAVYESPTDALSGNFVIFRDQNGDPLPTGSVTTITVNTTTGEIDDITFQES